MQKNRRFVAHIDILGMRAMVDRDPEMAWNVLSGLADVRDHIGQLRLTRIETAHQQMLAESVYSVMFSDTIVLFTKTDSNDDLQSILIAASEILHKAMCRLVPVRIGIAVGQFFFNIEESLYSGPALIEAYEIGEAAQWLGIVTSQDVFIQSKNAGFQSGTEDIVVSTQIPTDKGLFPGFAVNWIACFSHDFKVKPPISVELFYSQFEHAFGPFSNLPDRQRLKYENTVKFINEYLPKT
ncbi:MAG: hypothetical protein LW710_08690 [Burkholderiales bacterium]|jgi:hypothetical protein|uniref:hypothetical protein n=1 Tax=Limnobacter sp. TaxID=2003368 RepID=UPI0039BC9C4B|nr:hypothetical protein [Burkholderiales bacterium]